MKKNLLFLFLLIGLFSACSSDDNSPADVPLEEKIYTDIAYGSDPEQTMDVYLPAGRTTDTKVIVMIHGGFWLTGSKEDFADFIPLIKSEFPDYAIVNINYRLSTEESPAYPKQIEDLQKVFNYLKNESGYTISNKYGLIGVSAGAHLAMLYSYKYDTNHEVKAICDIVGSADFFDSAYTTSPLYAFAAQILLGTTTPTQSMITEVNPVSYITSQSAPTISFYGGADDLIPPTQGPLLKETLDNAAVANEFNFYQNGGHGDWDAATMNDVYTKLAAFFEVHF